MRVKRTLLMRDSGPPSVVALLFCDRDVRNRARAQSAGRCSCSYSLFSKQNYAFRTTFSSTSTSTASLSTSTKIARRRQENLSHPAETSTAGDIATPRQGGRPRLLSEASTTPAPYARAAMSPAVQSLQTVRRRCGVPAPRSGRGRRR